MIPSGLAHDHEAACAFSKAHDVWRTGDLEAFLALCHDDITWTVNMDGITVPYGSSSYGKEDLRWRLIQLGTVFDLKAFEIRSITHTPEHCSSRVYCHYVHRIVGEPRQITTHFRGWLRDNHLIRMEESVDAPYIEAYDRVMRYLDQQE